MTLRRTVLLGSVAWLVLLTGLHAWLNLDVFRPTSAGTKGLKIGYLPVT